jgi:GrpB-like predicted nucleotidyltransferase (UPF0157 family)
VEFGARGPRVDAATGEIRGLNGPTAMPEVVVVAWDPAWPARFEALRSRVCDAVRDVAVAIEHVGSTAVAGLASKPIIDMTVVVAARADVPAAIECLARVGYRHRGDLGIAGREAFHAPAGLPAHRLYVCAQDSIALANHLAVRDWLRSHPDDARAYGALKRRLAAQFRDDIDAYVDGKTEFLAAILANSGFAPDVLAEIAAANMKL